MPLRLPSWSPKRAATSSSRKSRPPRKARSRSSLNGAKARLSPIPARCSANPRFWRKSSGRPPRRRASRQRCCGFPASCFARCSKAIRKRRTLARTHRCPRRQMGARHRKRPRRARAAHQVTIVADELAPAASAAVHPAQCLRGAVGANNSANTATQIAKPPERQLNLSITALLRVATQI